MWCFVRFIRRLYLYVGLEMFVLEENKVRFIASDLVDPGKIEEKHSDILDMTSDDLYGCGCNDSHVQASALYQHKYYSLHHK